MRGIRLGSGNWRSSCVLVLYINFPSTVIRNEAGVVVGDGCVFAEVPKAPVRMTISEWMKAREQGVSGDIAEWEIGLTFMVTLATSGELTRNHGEARTRKEPVWVKKCGGPARPLLRFYGRVPK